MRGVLYREAMNQTATFRVLPPHYRGPAAVDWLLEKNLRVFSRSGLHDTEKTLVDYLPYLPPFEKLLILNNRTGVLGMAATLLRPAAQVCLHTFDIHHAKSMQHNIRMNKVAGVEAICTPDVPAAGAWDAALIPFSKGSLSGELMEDLLQQIYGTLKKGGVCVVAAEESPEHWGKRMREWFGGCSVRMDAPVPLLISRKSSDAHPHKSFEARQTMTLPGGLAFPVITIPGVFAHRQVDEGALALAETVAVQPGAAVLEMGCGCGAVGIALAKKAPLAGITFVDSNVRATYITERNCRENGVQNFRVCLSALGPDTDDKFSLVVGNPPYFADLAIAEFFIRVAHRQLAPGGHAWIVTKAAERLREFARGYFGKDEVFSRRRYQVIKLEQPLDRP